MTVGGLYSIPKLFDHFVEYQVWILRYDLLLEKK